MKPETKQRRRITARKRSQHNMRAVGEPRMGSRRKHGRPRGRS